MKTLATDTSPFELCGGHPALDFVNSLDNRFVAGGPREHLSEYTSLLRFTQQAGLLGAPQVRELGRTVGPAAASRVLRSARELREASAAVLYAQAERRAPQPAEVERLERCLREAEMPHHLEWLAAKDDGAAALQWQWSDEQLRAAGFPLWLIAHAASQLLLSADLAHVRACEADRCRWLFLDTSKNHTRRWCNMKVCGNRAKARRFQERRAE